MARLPRTNVEPKTNKNIGSLVASLEHECKVCKHSLLIVCLYYRTLPEYEKAATFLDILVCLKILLLFRALVTLIVVLLCFCSCSAILVSQSFLNF